MNKLVLASAAVLLLCASPVLAADPQLKPEIKKTWAERHPKLHKTGRRVRRLCQASLPVLQALSYAGTAVGGFSVAFRKI